MSTINRPRVTAIVLNYRNWPGVRDLLGDFVGQTLAPLDIVVVDNASGDGSAAQIQGDAERTGRRIHLLEMVSNNGYAAGINAGITWALSREEASEYLLLCTHDVRLELTCVERLVAALEVDRQAAVAGPLLGWASRPALVWSAGGSLNARTGRPFHQGAGAALDAARGKPSTSAAWLDGAVLLVRRSAVDEVGLLNESFFLYTEEIEWLLRMADRGHSAIVVPDAVAWQEPGMTPPYLEQRNRVLLYRLRREPRLVAVGVAAGLAAASRDAIRGDGRRARLRGIGVIHGLTGRLDRDLAGQR